MIKWRHISHFWVHSIPFNDWFFTCFYSIQASVYLFSFRVAIQCFQHFTSGPTKCFNTLSCWWEHVSDSFCLPSVQGEHARTHTQSHIGYITSDLDIDDISSISHKAACMKASEQKHSWVWICQKRRKTRVRYKRKCH